MPGADPRLDTQHLRDLVFLSDPRLTADGTRAFCVRTTVLTQEDRPPSYRAEVCELDLGAGDPTSALRPVTTGPADAEHPRPSPGGDRLAFLSEREGQAGVQVQILDLTRGGEARAATALASGARALAWRPDGNALVVLGSDEPPSPEGERVVARTLTRLYAKKDGLAAPGVRTEPSMQAWFVDLARGRARRLTDLPDGVTDAAWGPDGRDLWLLAPASVEGADEWHTRTWHLRLDARGSVRAGPKAVSGPLLRASDLAVAPDGRVLYWLAPSDPEQLASPTGLWTLRTRDGTPTLLSGREDLAPALGGDARSGHQPNRPVPTGESVVVNVHREGASAPAYLGPKGALSWRLPGRRATTAFAHAAGRTLCLVETPDRPGHLVLIEADGTWREVCDVNTDTARRSTGTLDGPHRAANEEDGVTWWRMLPSEPRQDHAVVVQVHGGPHTSAGYGFSFEHQVLAARGYTVVFQNPRGSASYGPSHAMRLLGAYGTVDADDVMSVVDEAIASHTDPSAPVHLTGGSYGGFMTNWLLGRTKRFRSAVTQRSICNWLSFYGTSDIGYRFAEYEVAGTPWADTERLWSQSPLKHVANVATPTLVLHADADHRCPVEQAEQWYVALKRLGRAETRLVRFPDEGHELSRSGRPDRRIRRLDEIVTWFETHA